MAAAAAPEQDTADEKVRRWRIHELERVGYNPEGARLLAGNPNVNLHQAVDLMRNGCSQRTAMRILL